MQQMFDESLIYGLEQVTLWERKLREILLNTSFLHPVILISSVILGTLWIGALSVFLVGQPLDWALHARKQQEDPNLGLRSISEVSLQWLLGWDLVKLAMGKMQGRVFQAKEATCKRYSTGNLPKKGDLCGWNEGSKEEGASDRLERQLEPDHMGPWWVTKRICLLTKKLRDYLKEKSGTFWFTILLTTMLRWTERLRRKQGDQFHSHP